MVCYPFWLSLANLIFNLLRDSYALGDNNFYFWDKDENKEVDADLFIRTNGTCEESVELVNNLLNNKSKEDMFK